MDIKELKQKKHSLEQDMRGIIAERLSDFREATGISPSGVSVYVVCVQTVGQAELTYIVDTVKVDIRL